MYLGENFVNTASSKKRTKLTGVELSLNLGGEGLLSNRLNPITIRQGDVNLCCYLKCVNEAN
jgi:hypothetical protein